MGLWSKYQPKLGNDHYLECKVSNFVIKPQKYVDFIAIIDVRGASIL